MRKIDLTGQKIGRLTVLHEAGNKGKHTMWRCACACGKESLASTSSLRNTGTKSCGCLTVEAVRKRCITHGESVGYKESKELAAWSSAKGRCYNANDEKYKNYGARGITMCDAWVNNSAQFLKDMGPCPAGYSLDRIDVNGNYEPSNCRWASALQQARNKVNTIFVVYRGEKISLTALAEKVNVPYTTLHFNYRTKKLPIEKAIAAYGARSVFVNYFGKNLLLSEFARRIKVPYKQLHLLYRRKKLSLPDAIKKLGGTCEFRELR